MQLTEAQLRQLLLAQSIERVDAERQLISQSALDGATQQAIRQARQQGCQRVQLADVLPARSQAICAQAAAQPAVAALAQPDPRWRWLQRGLPLLALLLGLLSDRIGNAQRVDLLSPALLLVLLWNVLVYGGIAWGAWQRRRQAPSAIHHAWLLAWLERLTQPQRRVRASLGGRLRADFYPRWLAHTGHLWAQRLAQLLHWSAAAWAAGLALSLLLRGLVVRYQIGWESTFLQAEQVHALVAVLAWPLTALHLAAPLTLTDISAIENFAAPGVAGSRWVWLYVGLLLLYVVLPRCLLAAASLWRTQQAASQCSYQPQVADWPALAQLLPQHWRVGLHSDQAEQVAALLRLAQAHQDQISQQHAHADILELSSDTQTTVDAVLQWPRHYGAALPAAWQAVPLLALDWQEFAASWTLEPALLTHLQALLPAEQHAGLARLRSAWQQHNQARFELALHLIAAHWRQHSSALDLQQRLLRLHGLEADASAINATSTSNAPLPSSDSSDELMRNAPLAVGAGAGALAGAKVGSMIDIGLGGLTLGAGTALGALIGSTTAWAARNLQDKEAQQQQSLAALENACMHYLCIAQQQRLTPAQISAQAVIWQQQLHPQLLALRPQLLQNMKLQALDTQALVPDLLVNLLRPVILSQLPACPPPVTPSA